MAACSLVVALGCGDTPAPEADLPHAWHDFGTLVAGSTSEHVFEGSNRGDAPLEFLSLRTSCGCSVAEIKAAGADGVWQRGDRQREDLILSVPPQGRFQVRLRILSGLIRQGSDEKAGQVLIQTNDPLQPWMRLEFHVRVDRPWEIDPDDLALGDVEPGLPARHVVRIRPRAGRQARVRLPRERPERVDLSLEDVAGGQDLVVRVDRDRRDPPGPFRIALRLPIEGGAADAALPLVLTGRVLPLIDVRPARLHFLAVPAGASATAEVTLFASAEARPWTPGEPVIRPASGAPADSLEARVVEVRPGAEYLLRLDLRDAPQEFVSGEVLLEPALEGRGSLVVPYVGLVRERSG